MRKIALLLTLLLIASVTVVACRGQGQQVAEDAAGEEVITTAASVIEEVAPTVETATSTVEVVATEEPTATASPTPEPTATPTATLKPSPTPKPSPIPTPTELPEGMVLYRYTFPDGNLLEAAIPQDFLGTLSVASHEVGSVDGVDFANLQIAGDTLLLGDIPVFIRVNDGWQINPEVRAIHYGVDEVMSPALAMTIRTQNDPEAASRLDPTRVHMIQFDSLQSSNQSSIMVTVDPAYIESVEFISVAVPLNGQVFQTKVALTTFTYLNSSGAITRCQIPLYEGVVVKNIEGTPLEEIYALVGDTIAFSMIGNFVWPPDNVHYVLMDISDAADDPYEIKGALEKGGLINIGWFSNVRQPQY